MTRRRRITWLDVFTSTPLAGNGLAVVHDADGVDDDTMLRFARETKLSETTFVQSATQDGADYRNRIFMPIGEIPFAGHPSLGTAVAVALERGEDRASYVQQTGAGLQPIDLTVDGDVATAWMTQSEAEFGEQLDPDVVLGAVGLSAQDAAPGLPPQIVATGVPQVIACVRDPGALGRITPDYDAIGGILGRYQAITVYVAHLDGETAVARSYMQQAEDPATGSSVGPLLALAHARLGTERLTIHQGREMGRPSVLHTRIEDGRVRVGGEVVVLFDGQIRLDG